MTGINTYSKMIAFFQKQMEELGAPSDDGDAEGERKESENSSSSSSNKLIENYLAKSRKAAVGSSFYGEVGRTNLVATLGDIFMGGRQQHNICQTTLYIYIYIPKNDSIKAHSSTSVEL